jgi:hypothetical protein
MSKDDSQQKGDLVWSWNRTDQDFFARGACHVLCAVFLRQCDDPDFTAQLILPTSNFRGRHVVAATSSVVFDWGGFRPREAFLAEYSATYRSKYPEWAYSLVPVPDPIGEDFCEEHHHRRPDQFLHDPIPRAEVYVRHLLKATAAS